jgi:HK97 family phage major capsid protein
MGNRKATDWVKNHIKANEGTDTAGGFTVPDPLSSDLIYLREQFGIARQNCRIYPMSSDTLRVPNATASTTVYYPGENTAITLSDMTFAQVSLTAKKAAVLTQVSKELAEDSIIDFGASLARDMAYVLAKEEDRVVFNNATDATTSIDGCLWAVYNANATKANIASLVQFTTGQTITYAPTLTNLSAMVGRLPTYAANAKWYMHKEIWYNAIAPLLNALSGNAILDLQQAFGAQPKLFGYDVVFVQNMQKTLAASTPYILLGDLSVGTAFGDRRSVTIEVSDQQYFKEDALAFKATERYAFNAFDIGNVNATASARVPGSLIVGASSAT